MGNSFFVVLSFMASSVQSACVDIGTESYQVGAHMVQICMGQECTTAAGWRECGNVHYASADFSSASNTWRFWVGYNDPDNDEDNDYSVFYEPVDPEELPMIVVDGVPIWPMREGLPLDLSAIKQVTCIPDSLAHACAFVNMVVENLRARDAD